MWLGLGDILEKAPQFGVVVILLGLLMLTQVYAFRDRSSARREMTEIAERHKSELDSIHARHKAELDSITTRYEAEIRRINADHDRDQAEWRAQARELRADLDELGEKLDAERRLRREAEDRAAMAGRPPQTARVVLELPGGDEQSRTD